MLYITPEYAENAVGVLEELDEKVGIALIAIDEAHCVSHWGHDFRSSYRELGTLRNLFPHVILNQSLSRITYLFKLNSF